MSAIHIPKEQHEINTRALADKAARDLADSPISRGQQLSIIQGFYMGYCSGREYDINPEVLSYIEKFI